MFENLSERLERSFKILKGEGRITEINVAETLKDVRRALLEADVNYKVAKTFTDQVKEKALGQNVLTAVKPGQLMVKIVHDELARLMGGEAAPFDVKGAPGIVLMAGLQGSGKTTMSGKLALWQKTKKGRRPMLAACDTLLFAFCRGLRRWLAPCFVLAAALFFWFQLCNYTAAGWDAAGAALHSGLSCLGPLAAGAVILLLYNGRRAAWALRRPAFAKYFFYLFYPAHLAVLALLRRLAA